MPLNPSEVSSVAMQYYSKFTCMDITKPEPGVHFVPSPERDRPLKGYGCKYSLYALHSGDFCVVAYSPALQGRIDPLKNLRIDELLAALDGEDRLGKMRLLLFERERVTDFGDTRPLCPADYRLFEAFFRQTHPNADPDGWLSDYFFEKVGKGYLTGYFKDGRLVCLCDAPDMPYMEDAIQHTGIMTLEGERQKGYGKLTAALATHRLLQRNICPQWECRIDNGASLALAKSIGYKEFATAYILER